jgi:membrane protein
MSFLGFCKAGRRLCGVVERSVAKFFADRGTHLAAMCAYYTLLAFFPLLFFALALLGLFGRASESSTLVTTLSHVVPGTSVASLAKGVRSVQSHVTLFSLLGIGFFIWSSLGLFSVLESAMNVVYDRPNRRFLRGKVLALTLMTLLLTMLTATLVFGSIGFDILRHFAGGVFKSPYVAYPLPILISLLGVFGFLLLIYYVLPNTYVSVREAVPGALVGAVALETSFQALPFYLRFSAHVVSWQALGAPIILLIWLYLMANFLVFGAEVNWVLRRSHSGNNSRFLGDHQSRHSLEPPREH